jgi:ABC-type antimicrobial peptide transport system permease subunit
MDLIRMQTVRERLLASISGFFAAVALALSGIGIYAVLSYTVVRQRREIAIRVALGARARNVAHIVLRDSGPVLAAGSALGLLLGLGAQGLIQPVLFEVPAHDPLVVASACLALLIVCAMAAAGPLVRAVRTDPARTMRAD